MTFTEDLEEIHSIYIYIAECEPQAHCVYTRPRQDKAASRSGDHLW